MKFIAMCFRSSLNIKTCTHLITALEALRLQHLPQNYFFLWLRFLKLFVPTCPTWGKCPIFFIPASFMIRTASFSWAPFPLERYYKERKELETIPWNFTRLVGREFRRNFWHRLELAGLRCVRNNYLKFQLPSNTLYIWCKLIIINLKRTPLKYGKRPPRQSKGTILSISTQK